MIAIELHARPSLAEGRITVAWLKAPVNVASVELVLVSDANAEV